MKHLDLSKWQVGDIMLTTSLSITASIIRNRTWPKGNIFDMGHSTHSAVVVDRGGGLLYACEMLPKGLSMTELWKYDRPSTALGGHLCMLLRHPLLAEGEDGFDRRNKLNDYCIRMHSFHVRYGYEDLLRFLWPSMPDDRYAMVCSQFTVSALNHVEVPLPTGWIVMDKTSVDGVVPSGCPGLVSPADIQRWAVDGKECIVVEGALK